MNATEIVNEVVKNNKSLVRLSDAFVGNNVIGYFVKDADGNLTKVHGNSAKVASRCLYKMDCVVRSYGKAKMTRANKTMAVFMTEFHKFEGVL